MPLPGNKEKWFFWGENKEFLQKYGFTICQCYLMPCNNMNAKLGDGIA